jgi:phospholipid/cholesterol/gamma-HCH transport system substrate-binding protein
MAGCVVLTATGCTFQGVNSLALPGAVGRGRDASIYHVEVANVGTLESNSPVMMADVVVGSVGKMRLRGWHADVEVSVQPGVIVPANAVAMVGQTSLLGSMHLALQIPLGQAPRGRLEAGATIPLDRSSTYPSTEQTLSSLSVIVNSGGLGHIGDIIHNFGAALSGNETQVRELLSQLDATVGTIDDQRDRMVSAIEALNRLAGTFAVQRDVVTQALHKIPPALDVLIRERPRITAALDKLRVFSSTTTKLVDGAQADLVKNLQNLGPTLQALADVGPVLDTLLGYLPTFPFTQDVLDRGIRGDYFNVFAVVDFTIPRLKRTLFLGTRWGDPNAPLVPAPGEPHFRTYTYDPLRAGVAPPPAAPPQPAAAPTPPQAPMPSTTSQVHPMPPDNGPLAPIDQPSEPMAGGG